MARYTLIDPVTGEQESLSEAELTRNLQLNCILLQDRKHIGIITRQDLVAFARWCAGETLTLLVDEPDQRVIHALTLIDRWLEDEKSVTPDELKSAADAAAWAAADAACADAAAAWAAAAGAARAAWVAKAAADAAAADAARAAWVAEAAAGAARAAWVAEATSFITQAQWLVEHLRSEK